jgi:hypothetical protein
MEWLSPTDFPAQQRDIIIRRQEGTGQWFVDSPEFKRWLQGSDKDALLSWYTWSWQDDDGSDRY